MMTFKKQKSLSDTEGDKMLALQNTQSYPVQQGLEEISGVLTVSGKGGGPPLGSKSIPYELSSVSRHAKHLSHQEGGFCLPLHIICSESHVLRVAWTFLSQTSPVFCELYGFWSSPGENSIVHFYPTVDNVV